MLSIMEASKTAGKPEKPKVPQPSLRMADASTRHITRFVWVLFPMTLIWAIAIYFIIKHTSGELSGPKWIYFGYGSFSSHFCFLLFVGGFQSFATMGLHSVELLVNRSRDELLWRRAAPHSRRRNIPGAPKSYGSIIAAVTSWQSVGLYAFKPIVHWLFGNSLSAKSNIQDPSAKGNMSPPYTFGLAAIILFLAFFGTILARMRPAGCIPAAWGHLQTLADLIDDWGDGDAEKLFWGDKGQGEGGVRHAGTAVDKMKLGEIQMDFLYS